MKRTVLITSLLLSPPLFLAPGAASAQDRWQLDLVPGVAVTTDEVAGADLDPGLGIEGTLSYRFMPHLAVYGGWDWRHFSTGDRMLEGTDIDIEESGYVFGLRFEHPLGDGRAPSLMLRLGASIGHLELEDEAGDIVRDSGHGLGWEAGAGLVLPIGDNWRLTPALRYRQLDRELDLSSGTVPANLRYVAFEIGFGRRF